MEIKSKQVIILAQGYTANKCTNQYESQLCLFQDPELATALVYAYFYILE